MPRPHQKQIPLQDLQIKTLLAIRLTGTLTQSRLNCLTLSTRYRSSILDLEAPSWVCQHVRWVRADSISPRWVLVRGPLAVADGPLVGGRKMTKNPSQPCVMPWNWASTGSIPPPYTDWAIPRKSSESCSENCRPRSGLL